MNAIAWAPHSHCHICSVGDDSQALIWYFFYNTFFNYSFLFFVLGAPHPHCHICTESAHSGFFPIPFYYNYFVMDTALSLPHLLCSRPQPSVALVYMSISMYVRMYECIHIYADVCSMYICMTTQKRYYTCGCMYAYVCADVCM